MAVASSECTRLPGCQIPDIALEEGEVVPLGGGNAGMDIVQVVLVAGGKVVQADDSLVQLEQRLQQIGADKAGDTGDEPRVFGIVEFVLHFAVGVFRHRNLFISEVLQGAS